MRNKLYTLKKVIEVSDWDNLVIETYGKPYNFQQQEGCQDRGQVHLTVPTPEQDDWFEEEMNDSIPEVVNGNEMGVKFNVWLARDPEQPLASGENNPWSIEMFWERNFYPSINTVANDLHAKGLLEAGDYIINIDW